MTVTFAEEGWEGDEEAPPWADFSAIPGASGAPTRDFSGAMTVVTRDSAYRSSYGSSTTGADPIDGAGAATPPGHGADTAP